MLAPRPILVLHKTKTDKAMEVLILVTLVATWILAIFSYNGLPEIIPVHYDLKGQVDNYGDKSSIWFLPIVSVVLLAGLRFINRFPHNFNYLVKITPVNALQEYKAATGMIRYIQLMVSIVFFLILFNTIQTAHARTSFLGAWFPPLLLLIFLLPVAIKLFSYRGKQKR